MRILAATMALGLTVLGAGLSTVAANAAAQQPIAIELQVTPDVDTTTPDDSVVVTAVVRDIYGDPLDGLNIQLATCFKSFCDAGYADTVDGFATFELGNLEAGSYHFVATFLGDTEWAYASTSLDYDVFYNQDDFAIVSPGDLVYGETGHVLTTEGAAVGSSITWEVTEGDDVIEIDPVTGELTLLAVGTATVEAYSSGNSVTREASASIDLVVDQRHATVAAISTPRTITFGDDYTLSVKVKGLVEGDELDGSVMLEDDLRLGDNAIVEDDTFENPNYSITFIPGVLTVLPNEAQQLALDAIADLPEWITDDADVAQLVDAYALVLALSEDEYAALPVDVIDKIDTLAAQAAILNHNDIASGVSASAETLPWSVKLVASIESDSASDFAAFEAKLPADRALVELYDIHFVDLFTGATWQPEVGEAVRIELANVDLTGRSNIGVSHMTVAATLEDIDATVDGQTVIFDGASFSQYGVTSDENTNDDLVNTGAATVMSVLLAAGVLAGAGGLLLVRRRATAK
jgi:hypothetical protein